MSMAVELRQAGSEQVLHRLMLEDVLSRAVGWRWRA